MADTLQQEQTAWNAGRAPTSTTWYAATFYASSAYTCIKIALQIYEQVEGVGTITIYLKAVDGDHKPTGDVLASGTTDGDLILTESPGDWRDFDLGAGVALNNGQEYAILGRSTGGAFIWPYHTTSQCDGGQIRSLDSGASWGTFGTADFTYKVYSSEVSTGASIPIILHHRKLMAGAL